MPPLSLCRAALWLLGTFGAALAVAAGGLAAHAGLALCLVGAVLFYATAPEFLDPDE